MEIRGAGWYSGSCSQPMPAITAGAESLPMTERQLCAPKAAVEARRPEVRLRLKSEVGSLPLPPRRVAAPARKAQPQSPSLAVRLEQLRDARVHPS
jgi:hypothetical protein